MLYRRLFSATVLVCVAVLLIVLDVRWPLASIRGGWVFPLFLAFTLGTVWEATQLLSRLFPMGLGLVVTLALAASCIAMFPVGYSIAQRVEYPDHCPLGRIGWVLIGCLSGVGFTGVAAILQLKNGHDVFNASGSSNDANASEHDNPLRMQFERTTVAWIVSSFVIMYVVGCMSFWFLVRMHDGSYQGILNLVSLLAIVKFADVGAYFAGKSFGKTKLIPMISPGKTVEGLLGGLALSIGVAYLFLRLLIPWMGGTAGTTWYGPAILGTLMTLVGLVGDLLESMIKRMVGAKDSGTMLPGLGGVWDVTDSLLPTAIVGYLGVIAKLT